MPDSETIYAVVADPRGDSVTIDEEIDGVLCTGDVLNIVPPPGGNVDGSLYEERFGSEGYDEDSKEVIIENTEELFEQADEVAFEERYRRFLHDTETPFYTVYGNLDDPESYQQVSEGGSHMHIDDLADVSGIDGVIPGVSGIPEGVFPVEIDEKEFYQQAQEKDGEILIAHSIPEGFDPTAYGFEAAFCSEGEQNNHSDAVHRLPSYKETRSYERVRLS